MDDGGFPLDQCGVVEVSQSGAWALDSGPCVCVFTRMIVWCSLSLSRALSASDADSLSALLRDCRIGGSEEDPHFPVDRLLFIKSLDIFVFALVRQKSWKSRVASTSILPWVSSSLS